MGIVHINPKPCKPDSGRRSQPCKSQPHVRAYRDTPPVLAASSAPLPIAALPGRV